MQETGLSFFSSQIHKFYDILNKIKHLYGSPDLVTEDMEELEEKLIALEHEHKDLDDIIDRLRSTPPVDFLQVKRLQKKKLMLKDQIQKLRSSLLPDIIA